MTPRENFSLMMNGAKGAQWLPLALPATRPVVDLVEAKLGTRDLTCAFNLDFGDVKVGLRDDVDRWKAAYTGMGVEIPADAEFWGLGVVKLPPPPESVGSAYHLRTFMHPLAGFETVAQLESLPWPDLNTALDDSALAGRVKEVAADGHVSVCGVGSIFEASWYVRGMDGLFADIIEENGVGDWLLEWFTELNIRRGAMAARAGVDVLILGDDVGTQRGMMMSVDFWREHFKPRLKRVIDSIRANQTQPLWIYYHSDGDVRPILNDLAEVGVDILNPVQPECMPVEEVIREHRHHLKFWGMVGTQTTMPFGTPDDVRRVVADCARYAREGAGVVVAPTHVLEPDVPWENIEALVEAVKTTRL